MKSLKAYRESKRLTQSELADLAGVHLQTIFKIENQKTVTTSEVRKAIEGALGVRINWLSSLSTEDVDTVSWEEAEQSLRKVLINAQSLSANEREQFASVAHEYINTFEDLVEEKAMDDLPFPVPPEVTEAYRRKRIYRAGE
jgi:transcriptional regulator with XRE-family HTH domain